MSFGPTRTVAYTSSTGLAYDGGAGLLCAVMGSSEGWHALKGLDIAMTVGFAPPGLRISEPSEDRSPEAAP